MWKLIKRPKRDTMKRTKLLANSPILNFVVPSSASLSTEVINFRMSLASMRELLHAALVSPSVTFHCR